MADDASTSQRGAYEDDAPYRWQHNSAVPVRCHGGRERGAVGSREVQTIIVVAVVALHCVA